ncbi:uncharacterized protein Dwil_GK14485 [Drosophila willistoni]|uniref:Fat body protein 2 n=1 Tax=Drosophila willistoni TaxID=7260 RepID=B4MX76_DROWI|nr:alcohol dehydrogenase 1 [Drosophila willistoni]EDW76909.1 uncharacterized protein Dwil_GK14485 [Drosophila willistoni]
MDLANRNVVYLGGFGGIGQQCVQELLQKQLKSLAIFDLMENDKILSTWQQNYPQTDIFYHKVDITKKSNIEAAYKATSEHLNGHIDVVVNGMGLMNDRHIELTIEINLLGVIHSTLTALEYMSKPKGGQGGLIVNISSVAGLQPTPLMAIYSAAKTGVTTFTRAMANPFYFSHSGVGFITICPGFTNTALLDDIDNKTTFTYRTPMHDIFPMVKRQNANDCARNLIKSIEEGHNGDVLMLELGEITKVDIPEMWKPQLEQ